MNRQTVLANSVLWATAIVSSAAWGAPAALSLGLLPCLAAISIVGTSRRFKA